jgi:hypothetical protein
MRLLLAVLAKRRNFRCRYAYKNCFGPDGGSRCHRHAPSDCFADRPPVGRPFLVEAFARCRDELVELARRDVDGPFMQMFQQQGLRGMGMRVLMENISPQLRAEMPPI